ncbi:hypothetical protein AcW1_002499 [Taiwanofungus camphoratus]|nr:hypothetical protein AcW1_002499 [Antrodia cinnamomea]
MRFLRLSHLFHRRTKSDSALDALLHADKATPTSRPVSASCVDELAFSDTPPLDLFAQYVSAVPISISVSSPSPVGSLRASSPLSGELPSAQLHLTVSDLVQRIRELEAALQYQYEVNRRIPALEAALQAKQQALCTAQQTNEKLAEDVATIRASLINTQRALHAARAHPNADDRSRILAAENTALAEERLRHRRFIELMIAAGGHKPVLSQAFHALANGANPEMALITAIREAAARPESPWATIVEAVTVPRTSAEYAAQVRCTLNARQNARTWHKRATFWRRKAKEGGNHTETVTPSPSNISSVADELSLPRQRAVSELLESLRSGIHPLQIQARLRTQQMCSQPESDHRGTVSTDAASEGFAPPACLTFGSMTKVTSGLPSILDSLSFSAGSSFADVVTKLPPSSSSSVIPVSHMTSVVASSSSSSKSGYTNLPPLASETFRASHSIPRVSSRRSILYFPLSRSVSCSLSRFGYASAFGRASITTSASASTQASDISARSRRRRVEVVAVAQARQPSIGEFVQNAPADLISVMNSTSNKRVSVSADGSVPGYPDDPASSSGSSNGDLGSCRHIVPTEDTAPERSAHSTARNGFAITVPAPVAACSTSSPASSVSPSYGISLLSSSPEHRPRTPELEYRSDSTAEDSDEELVIVMHSDVKDAPDTNSTPYAFKRAVNQKTPSPEKSRLPVPVLKKAIRRLSISRPVLIDTTNAATFTFATASAKTVTSVARKEAKASTRVNGKTMHEDKNASAEGNGRKNTHAETKVGSAGAGSPPRPTKIPMGRRIQQMPADLMDTARRAVQTKTRLRAGTD